MTDLRHRIIGYEINGDNNSKQLKEREGHDIKPDFADNDRRFKGHIKN